jgi:hypothetical protein
METYQLWLTPSECRAAVKKVLDERAVTEVFVADLALWCFGLQEPDRAASTQIGLALQHFGWTRIERRTKKPRFIWVKV